MRTLIVVGLCVCGLLFHDDGRARSAQKKSFSKKPPETVSIAAVWKNAANGDRVAIEARVARLSSNQFLLQDATGLLVVTTNKVTNRIGLTEGRRYWVSGVISKGKLLVRSLTPDAITVLEDTAGKGREPIVLGGLEHVTIVEAGRTLRARLDTGATTCSISAIAITPFERDGKKWVRFTIPDTSADTAKKDTGTVLESRIVRVAEIKQHQGKTGYQKRYVVKLTLEVSGLSLRREFTLVDRRRYDNPVLIGRNLLAGEIVVDVIDNFIADKRIASQKKKGD